MSIFIMLVHQLEYDENENENEDENNHSSEYQPVSQFVEDDYPEPVQSSVGLVIENYFAQEKEI
jgi:hypothetical protein